MIALVQDDNIITMPAMIDVTQEQVIDIYSDAPVTTTPDIAPEIIAEDVYRLTLTNLEDKTILVIANGIEEVRVSISNTKPTTDYLKSWLTMQQLDYLIPIVERIDWTKLKEAALKAKMLADMQGTEFALREMLKLLEVDDNVELFRYWTNGEDDELDKLHSIELAKLGYALTHKLKLRYAADRLNSWSDTIYDNVQAMLVTLSELVVCLQQTLPATLEITSYELVRVGLGIINYHVMTARSMMQTSDADVNIAISLPSVLQYSFENFVYDLSSKSLLRIANASEPNSDGQYMVALTIAVEGTAYDFALSINDVQYVYADTLSGKNTFCITPEIGKFKMSWQYRTDSGNFFSFDKDVTVLPACSKQGIYRLVEANTDAEEPIVIEAGGIANFMTQWQKVALTCNGRPLNVEQPKPYQRFYIPLNDCKRLRINDGQEVKEYDLHAHNLDIDIPGFTVSIENYRLFGSNDMLQDIVLMSEQYLGKYDLSVDYNDGSQWLPANQLSKILTSMIEPLWSLPTILAFSKVYIDKSNGMQTAQIAIDDDFLQHGAFIPVPLDDYDDFSKRCKGIENCIVNEDASQHPARLRSIAREDNTARLRFISTVEVACKNVRRRPSFCIQEVATCTESLPYVICRPNTWLELYANDMLIRQARGLLVFAKAVTAKYKLHIYNDWFDKTIEL